MLGNVCAGSPVETASFKSRAVKALSSPTYREAVQARQSQCSMACKLNQICRHICRCLPLRSRTYACPPTIRGQPC